MLSWIAFKTLACKELVRIARIWKQTLIPPIIKIGLYFIIFGHFIGSQISPIDNVPFMDFIIPGLVMMAIITNAYSNVVSSFFGAKFQRSIEELLVSPTPNVVIILGYVVGGVFRGVLVGCIVMLIALLFSDMHIDNIWIVLSFMILASILFSLGGMTNALFAKKFDDVTIISEFVLFPLIYLGGVFYSIHMLPPWLQTLSLANPILYMINGIRYGFWGISDVDYHIALVMILFFIISLFSFNFFLLKRRIGLKI